MLRTCLLVYLCSCVLSVCSQWNTAPPPSCIETRTQVRCTVIPPPDPHQKGETSISVKDCTKIAYSKCGEDHCPTGIPGAPGGDVMIGTPRLRPKGEGPAPPKGSSSHHANPYGAWHKGSWPHVPFPKGFWSICQWPIGGWPKGSYPCEPKGSTPVSTHTSGSIGCPGSIVPPPSVEVELKDCVLPSGDPLPEPAPQPGCCENYRLSCPK